MRVVTPQQMREADAAACERTGDAALMRAAGAAVAQAARHYAASGCAVAFAGRGNNGGDAYAALAELPEFDCVVYADPVEKPSAARADAMQRAKERGVRTLPLPKTLAEACAAVNGAALLFDGLVGTGARLPLPESYHPAVEAMNRSAAPVIAIDLPSGIDAGTGSAAEIAVHARATVTIGALKLGLLLSPARAHCADLWVAPIGLEMEIGALSAPLFEALDDREFLDLLPVRASGADKRSAGSPLVIAGSEQFPGAAVLCALGAARAGAGYVTVAAPPQAAAALRMHFIEQVVVTIDPQQTPEEVASDLLDVGKRCSSLAIGPGLGLDERTGAIVREICARTELPVVADASALFHFAKHLELLRGKHVVLTPHAGEFARLSGKGTLRESERIDRLREFVDRTGITTLLKGESTLVYDGRSMSINTTGTPALATAGTGDVLTGIIATLLAQGLSPFDAARAGAYWHGLAARHAAGERPRGVIARDVADALGRALPECYSNARKPASSSTGMPRLCALVSLLPASSPATT